MSNSRSSSASIDTASLRDTRASLSIQGHMALRALGSLQAGQLEIRLPDGSERLFVGTTRAESLSARIVIHDTRAFDMAVSRGDIGFGEGFMEGLWSSPDLSCVLKLFAANRGPMEQLIYGRWWATLWDQFRHLLRSNRKSQAKKNIAAHYDLGNEFYSLFLDPTMTYSSGLFDQHGAPGQAVDLEQGQCRKIDRALMQLRVDQLGPQAKLLEIGCGWGGLANRFLSRSQAQYVGLTLSKEQQKWARELLADHGRRADVRLQDYRDVSETFDGIVSIEMFEAVGEAYWNAYFSTIAKALTPSGRAVIQTITIDDALFDRYRKGTDFIQQYIFPGGMLPSPSEFEKRAKAQGLLIEDSFFFGQDYARTLAEWLKTFDSKRSVVESQGFGPEFCRMWQFYLAYCEAGFAENNINVAQFTLRKTS